MSIVGVGVCTWSDVLLQLGVFLMEGIFNEKFDKRSTISEVFIIILKLNSVNKIKIYRSPLCDCVSNHKFNHERHYPRKHSN